MKAVSTIIVAVVVLLIAVSLTTFGYAFLSEIMSTTTESGSQAAEKVTSSLLAEIKIESLDETANTIYVKNSGRVNLSQFYVYVNDALDSGAIPDTSVLVPGNVTAIFLTSLDPGDVVKVTSSNNAVSIRTVPGEGVVRIFVYDDEDPTTFGGGWGWDGWDACCRDSAEKYYGTYSYRVEGGSEAWTSPLPDSSGTSSFTFAYKKQDPNAYFSVYYFVNGYWHQVTDSSSHSYQGWSIPHIADTNWHIVTVSFSTATVGTNGNPLVSSEGQITNFEYGPGGSNVVWFDYTFFS
jgi:archaellum component FlaG (FlaF/FlaG flagellin family)